jgi:hypothetical protein
MLKESRGNRTRMTEEAPRPVLGRHAHEIPETKPAPYGCPRLPTGINISLSSAAASTAFRVNGIG